MSLIEFSQCKTMLTLDKYGGEGGIRIHTIRHIYQLFQSVINIIF